MSNDQTKTEGLPWVQIQEAAAAALARVQGSKPPPQQQQQQQLVLPALPLVQPPPPPRRPASAAAAQHGAGQRAAEPVFPIASKQGARPAPAYGRGGASESDGDEREPPQRVAAQRGEAQRQGDEARRAGPKRGGFQPVDDSDEESEEVGF